MLFNSIQFGAFFIVVFGLYIALRNRHRWQNRMLLVASYIFYGAWDWRFLLLIFASTVLDYFCGIKIHESNDPLVKKRFLFLSVFINLSILGFFKYFGFFTSSVADLLSLFGFSVQPYFLKIILPVGISFYTFQTMSYTIDIYRKRMKPTRNFLDFSLFVAFFPQLVAGPIERARHLLPQVLSPRKLSLDNFYEGCYLIFWGLFLKVFVADNLATIVDAVFAGSAPYNGAHVLLASYAFIIQLFGDFAGYSTIARGLGKCMGFNIMVNFNLPFFATNPGDFWQRWHISLSTWIRDYVYQPLRGSTKGPFQAIHRNMALFITMVLIGLWHGAAWTFVIFGVYHGLLQLIYQWLSPLTSRIKFSADFANKVWFFIRIAFWFNLIAIPTVAFRAVSVTQTYDMFTSLFINFQVSDVGLGKVIMKLLFFIGVLVTVQIYQYRKKDLMVIQRGNIWIRAIFYIICFYLLIIYGAGSGQEFIYFQF